MDNHEFSWLGWQSLQIFEGRTHPAQTRKVAAMQAFFEYQPARMSRPNSNSLDKFEPPHVVDTPVTAFDDHGLGTEPNNLTAVHCLKGYRAIRYGKNMELIVTDQRTFCSEDLTGREEAKALSSDDFPEFMPQEAIEILDAGRTYNGGKPPNSIRFGGGQVANFAKDRPAQTILGIEQKTWFLEKLGASKATWKIWGILRAPWTCEPIPRICPRGWASRGRARVTPDSAEVIGAPLTSSVRKSTISSATTKSPGSRQSQAIATAFGQVTRQKRYRPRNLSRSASHS